MSYPDLGNCQHCDSKRLARLHCLVSSDCCSMDADGFSQVWGYVPTSMGIGGGSYIEFNYCLDCGRIQGEFPIPMDALAAEVASYED